MRNKEEIPHPGEDNGILLSRFNIHQVLYNVKSGIEKSWSEVYYNPTLTAGCRVKSDPGVSKNLYNWENISIDKIVLLFDAPQIGKPATKNFWSNWTESINWGLTEHLFCGSLYKNSVKWQIGYFIQWGSTQGNAETIRIEFNPNKVALEPLAILFWCLGKNAINTCRVSRIDIACDYGIYLNPLFWSMKKIQQSSQFEVNGLIKTRYFGAGASDVQVRIYDKKYELQQHKVLETDAEYFWRVEAQVKSIPHKHFFLTDASWIGNFNPFESLGYYDPFGFDIEKEDAFFCFFLLVAKDHGMHYALSHLSKNTKKSYIERLKNKQTSSKVHLSSELYCNVFKGVYQDFTSYLQKLFSYAQKRRRGVFQDITNFLQNTVSAIMGATL